MESLERKLQQQLAEMAAKFEQKLLEQNSTLEQKMEASETRLIQALPSETNLVAPMNERLDQQTNQMTQQMTHQMAQQNMMMANSMENFMHQLLRIRYWRMFDLEVADRRSRYQPRKKCPNRWRLHLLPRMRQFLKRASNRHQ